MQNLKPPRRRPSPALRRIAALAGLASLGLAPTGCARDRGEITPTTLGTDLKQRPRGRMQPFAWPGQDIVRARPAAEPGVALTSGGRTTD